MKNFRKVLALVLVVATLFSFTAMASAKKYEDAADIDYKMAVDVLSAVGILDGYEVAEDEYEFHPQAYIEREEMAKMIAVLANAGTDVSKLYAKATPFADVPETAWSASYVAYCAKTGIIDGMTATTFAPDANVTALQTAKMLLVVLGFDGKTREYTGASWDLNVMKDAKVMGLFAGFPAGYDVNSKITRELAAQMMLNALKAPCAIGIKDGKAVKLTNALVFEKNYLTVNGDKIETMPIVTSYATLMDAIKAGNWALYEGTVLTDDLLKDHLFPVLTIGTSAECFHRDAAYFSYVKNGVKVAEGTYASEGGKAYTTKVDLAKDFKGELKTQGVEIYLNGQKVGWYANAETKINGKTAAETVADLTGNGVDTVVYKKANTAGTYYLEVNIIETFVAKVTNVDDYKNTFDLYLENETTWIKGVKIVEPVKKGDVVMLNLCDADVHKTCFGANNSATTPTYDVHSYYVAEPVVAKVDYARHYNVEHLEECFVKTTDAETFKYNENYGDAYLTIEDAQETTDAPKHGDTKAFYFDKYGYIMLITAPKASAATVAYFEEGAEDLVTLKMQYTGQGAFTPVAGVTLGAHVYGNAAEETVVTTYQQTMTKGTVTYDLWVNDAERLDRGTGFLASYKVDADGMAYMSVAGEYVAEGTISKNSSSIYTTDGDQVVLTPETKFIIRTTEPKSGDWTYTEVTGYKALEETYVIDEVTPAAGAYTNGRKGTNAQVIHGNDQFADYVFIDAKFVAVATEFFVMGDAMTYEASWSGLEGVLAKGQTYYAYRALVNGADSLILTTSQDVEKALYTAAAKYAGVVLSEDGDEALYAYVVKADDIIDDFNNGVLATRPNTVKNISISVVGEQTYVTYVDTSADKKTTVDGAEKIAVYHIIGTKEAANGYTGFWTEYNKVNAQLANNTVNAYFVRNTDGLVTAIYLVQAGAGIGWGN